MGHDSENITLYGAGGHCKVVMDILNSIEYKINKVVDDNPSATELCGIPIYKASDNYSDVIITIGNCAIRKKIASKLDVHRYITAIHPSAIISPTAKIGDGTVIMQASVIQASAIIGDHCIINTKASVDHDSNIGNYVHIAPGATICGEVKIGECTWIGAGCVVKQCVKIGSNCMIGAGSVVLKDIPDNCVAYGNPCRIKRRNNNI